MRANNFKKMRKLVKKDRRTNDVQAEQKRLGIEALSAKQKAVNLEKAKVSGGVVDSSDDLQRDDIMCVQQQNFIFVLTLALKLKTYALNLCYGLAKGGQPLPMWAPYLGYAGSDPNMPRYLKLKEYLYIIYRIRGPKGTDPRSQRYGSAYTKVRIFVPERQMRTVFDLLQSCKPWYQQDYKRSLRSWLSPGTNGR